MIFEPDTNAYAERWVGSARREGLHRMIIRSRRHLERVLDEYVDHYNRARPHRGLQLHPQNGQLQGVGATGAIRGRARLGGLLREILTRAKLGGCMNHCIPQPYGDRFMLKIAAELTG